jgi:hypothetical protein
MKCQPGREIMAGHTVFWKVCPRPARKVLGRRLAKQHRRKPSGDTAGRANASAGENGQRTALSTFDNAIFNHPPRDAAGAELACAYYGRRLRSLSFPGKWPCCPRSCCVRRSPVLSGSPWTRLAGEINADLGTWLGSWWSCRRRRSSPPCFWSWLAGSSLVAAAG